MVSSKDGGDPCGCPVVFGHLHLQVLFDGLLVTVYDIVKEEGEEFHSVLAHGMMLVYAPPIEGVLFEDLEEDPLQLSIAEILRVNHVELVVVLLLLINLLEFNEHRE